MSTDNTNTSVSVRPLRDSDFDEWRELWTGYLVFYKTEVAPELYRSSFERLLSNRVNEFNGLVAVKDGKLIGLTHYLLHRHGWKIENVTYLQDLFVTPSVRGSGAGRALIEAVYAKADEAGSPSVYWNTDEANETARKLYDRIGTKTPFIKYRR